VLEVGAAVPKATVWTAPREATSVDALVRDGPVLLVFYLFDWSST
jgi:hypothetical protein